MINPDLVLARNNADKAEELKEFIKKQKIKFDKPADQVRLFVYLNELTK